MKSRAEWLANRVERLNQQTQRICKRIERKRARLAVVEEKKRTWLERAMRTLRPTAKDLRAAEGPLPSGIVNVVALANELGVSARTIQEWTSAGYIPNFKYRGRRRYVLRVAKAAVEVVRLPNGKVYNARGSERTLMLLCRAAERASSSDKRACGACRQVFPISTYPPSQQKRGTFTCSDCMSPYRRASDARRRSSIELTQVEHVSTLRVAKRDDWTCSICKQPGVTRATWSLDHVIPLSKGGSHTYGNIRLAHRVCNSRKNNKMP